MKRDKAMKNRIPRLTAVLAALLLTAGPVYAQFDNVTRDVSRRGTAAADFLSIPVGARATAMGGAITASIDDPTAVYWNPAGLGNMEQGGLSVEYAQWLAEIDFNFVSVVLPTRAGNFGLGVTSMRSPEMDVTTVDAQNGTGETFSADSYVFALSYGRALTERFSMGGTVKYITERIADSNAGGFAVDLGTTFVTPFYGIRLGAAISNFGTKMQMSGDDLLVRVDIDENAAGNNSSSRALLDTEAFDLPLTMRIGMAGEVFQSGSARLTLAVEARSPNNSEQYVNLGAELGLLGDLVMLRGGYSELFLDDAVRSFSLGAGLNYAFGPLSFIVDYAYEEQEFFDGVNRFTLGLQF